MLPVPPSMSWPRKYWLSIVPPPLGISSHTQWLHRYPQAEAPKSITRLYDDTLAFIVCSVSVFVRMCMYMDVCILCSFIAEGLCEYRNLFVGTGGGEWPTNLYNNLGYVLYILSHMRARAVCNIPELGYYGWVDKISDVVMHKQLLHGRKRF